MGIKGVGLDSPLKLITYVLDQAVATLGNIDGVIITGDFVRHNFDYCDGTNAAKCDGVTKEHKLEQIKAIWKNMTDLIQSKFPNIPIIPTFGNNDNMVDYGPPVTTLFNADTNPYSQFKYLYELWFQQIPANVKHLSKFPGVQETIDKTFAGDITTGTGGGWYEYPFNN